MKKSKPATTTTKNSSYQSSKNRQFSEGFVYKQLQDVKSNTALTLWPPGWCLQGTVCRRFSQAALHNRTGLRTRQKGGTGSSQGVFGHHLRKQIFKQALIKRPPIFISPWSSRHFIQHKLELLTNCIFLLYFFFFLGSKGIGLAHWFMVWLHWLSSARTFLQHPMKGY